MRPLRSVRRPPNAGAAGKHSRQTRRPNAAKPQTAAFTFANYFRLTGKPRLAQNAAKITARRKSTEWSALEKPVAPLPSPPLLENYLKFVTRFVIRTLELAKGFEPPTP